MHARRVLRVCVVREVRIIGLEQGISARRGLFWFENTQGEGTSTVNRAGERRPSSLMAMISPRSNYHDPLWLKGRSGGVRGAGPRDMCPPI